MDLTSLLLTLFVGIFIVIGSLLGVYSRDNRRVTDMSVSIAFGVIMGLIIFEILPESYEILSEELGTFRAVLSLIILTALGIMLLKTLDMFVPCHEHEEHHEHEHKNDDCHNEHLHHIGIISSVAIIIHNLIEGAGLYLIAKGDITSGLLLCLGVGLHNVPMGLVITTTLINSNMKKLNIFAIIAIVSVSTFIGGLIMAICGNISELTEGLLLGLTLGMLVYISVFELAHQIYHMDNRTLSRMCILFGLAILVSSVLIGHFVGE